MCKIEDTLSGNKPIFMEFYASWCPHCQRMSPIIDELKEQNSWLEVKKFDIDDPKNEELIRYYKIEAIPTMMFFKDKELLWRQSGEMEYEQLNKTIQRYNS